MRCSLTLGRPSSDATMWSHLPFPIPGWARHEIMSSFKKHNGDKWCQNLCAHDLRLPGSTSEQPPSFFHTPRLLQKSVLGMPSSSLAVTHLVTKLLLAVCSVQAMHQTWSLTKVKVKVYWKLTEYTNKCGGSEQPPLSHQHVPCVTTTACLTNLSSNVTNHQSRKLPAGRKFPVIEGVQAQVDWSQVEDSSFKYDF